MYLDCVLEVLAQRGFLRGDGGRGEKAAGVLVHDLGELDDSCVDRLEVLLGGGSVAGGQSGFGRSGVFGEVADTEHGCGGSGCIGLGGAVVVVGGAFVCRRTLNGREYV